MKMIFVVLALAGSLTGCAFIPPQAPLPDEKGLVPVNASMPPAVRAAL